MSTAPPVQAPPRPRPPGPPLPAAPDPLASLLRLQRRYREEQVSMQAAIDAAQRALDAQLHREWLHCVSGELHLTKVRARTERLQAELEARQRDLADLRAALAGVAAEIRSLIEHATRPLVGLTEELHSAPPATFTGAAYIRERLH